MKSIRFSGSALAFVLLSTSAFADTATIPVSPMVDFLKPYIDLFVQDLVAAVFSILSIYVIYFANKWMNIKVSATSLDKLKSAAATQAGVMVAAAEDNMKSKVITVSSPGVAAAANKIIEMLPDATRAVGATPEAIQTIVVGEIGKLQAAASPSVIPVPVIATGEVK